MSDGGVLISNLMVASRALGFREDDSTQRAEDAAMTAIQSRLDAVERERDDARDYGRIQEEAFNDINAQYQILSDRRDELVSALASVTAAHEATARENAALREARDKDRERLDWLEANKKHGRGGWEVVPANDGWPLKILTRGPFHSLRAAIDAASRAVPPTTES